MYNITNLAVKPYINNILPIHTHQTNKNMSLSIFSLTHNINWRGCTHCLYTIFRQTDNFLHSSSVKRQSHNTLHTTAIGRSFLRNRQHICTGSRQPWCCRRSICRASDGGCCTNSQISINWINCHNWWNRMYIWFSFTLVITSIPYNY